MLPPDLRSLVAARSPVDEREATAIVEILRLSDALERPFDEEADPTHVTASAIVVGRRGVVLHLHKRMGLWLQPGGHVERGESVAEAAKREALEETGLVVDHPGGVPTLVHVDVHQAPKGHTHLDLRYLLQAGDGDPVPGPGESPDARWFSWDEALAVADDGLRGALLALRPPQPGPEPEARSRAR